jgi:hypothetical protein
MRVSSLLSCVLIATLTTSPLMAQNPAPNLRINTTAQYYDTSLVGTSILMALPSRAEAASMAAEAAQSETKAPGKTKSAIIGILIAAGVATAIIMLLSGGGDKDPVPVAAPVTPVGTILAAGTPRVNSPNQ